MKKSLILLISAILILTGCNNTEINNNENTVNDNETTTNNNENIVLEKKGHTLDTSVGKFIIDKDGLVYYENYETITYMGVTYELTTKDLTTLGTKQQYTNYTYQNAPTCNIEEGCNVEAYKLDLENISSVYEVTFGNGSATIGIIFLTYEGEVHELMFNLAETDKIVSTKNVSEYSNIVSVVPNMSFGGHSAILIDKNGNKYEYNGA